MSTVTLRSASRASAALPASATTSKSGSAETILPSTARATVEGVRVAVVHETGGRTGREARADADHPDTDLLVFGHSHIPWDTTSVRGLRLLNPGSPTDRRRQPTCTFLTAVLLDGEVREVVLHPTSRDA